MICPNCGNQVPVSAKICGYCGRPLRRPAQPPPPAPPAPPVARRTFWSGVVGWLVKVVAGLLTTVIIGAGGYFAVDYIKGRALPASSQPALSPVIDTPADAYVPTSTIQPAEQVGPKVLLTAFDSEVPTLDPAVAAEVNSIQVIDETFIGLTRLDENTGIPGPAMATSWESVGNADGTETVTFHLRTDVPWVRWNGSSVETVKGCDGSTERFVTADDFAYGIERTLNPANASPYGYMLGLVVKGAADYNNGRSHDFSSVGVRAIDDGTLQMTFTRPAVYNIVVAGLWVARPQPKWLISGDCNGAVPALGTHWMDARSFEGYGPWTVSTWDQSSEVNLVKNPFWPGTPRIPQATIEEVRFVVADPSTQLAQYKAGQLDRTSSVPLDDLSLVRADTMLSRELRITPQACTYYYGFNTKAPVVNDQRIRLALSEAVDRQSLIDNVIRGGQIPAQWFAPPGIAGAPTLDDHPELGIKYDPEDAKAQLQSYLDSTGKTADQLDLTLMFNTSSAHQRIAEAVQKMWKEKLGVSVKLSNQEWATYLKTTAGNAAPQIWRLGWCKDYPDANNFDREVFAANGAENAGGGVNWRNSQFEALVQRAAVEPDPSGRVELYAEAEEILVKTDAVIIPLYWYTNLNLVKPYVVAPPSMRDSQYFEKWDILAH
jgi:oligopeptide transport system substrate-binding protein